MGLEQLSFDRACLVVAHPDDEVLWFSSVLARVARLVICYEDCAEYPRLGPARAGLRARYPMDNVTWLRLPEPCSLHLVDWSQPREGAYGMELNARCATEADRQRYVDAYGALLAALGPALEGAEAVFTHNPWGEYGHADHVQVSHVVRALCGGAQLFYSGYIAARTMPLAARHLPGLGGAFELTTDAELVGTLQRLYVESGCWTWPRRYTRFERESFLRAGSGRPAPGDGVSLACVAV